MANLLAPVPQNPEHIQVFRDRPYPLESGRTFVGNIAAATRDPTHADRPCPSTTTLEREARWVCEWWPPE